jgi:probable F420-dependent oxidoreductase
MKLGVFGLNAGAPLPPTDTVRLARLCEELGYDSWWAGEHIVLPNPRVPPSPLRPGDPILDPLVHLAFVAAATTRLELGTGIIILPQRNPLVLAKQVASLDVLSNGRLHLGLGVGYLEPELSAIGVPMANRGARSDEYLDAMLALWGNPAEAYHGRYVDFAGVEAFPKPVRDGSPRIVIGGHTASAHRRAVQRGHGWYGFALTPETTAIQLEGLRAAAEQVERSTALGPLEVSVTPMTPVDQATFDAFAELGVDRLIVYPLPLRDVGDVEEFIRDHAQLVNGR